MIKSLFLEEIYQKFPELRSKIERIVKDSYDKDCGCMGVYSDSSSLDHIHGLASDKVTELVRKYTNDDSYSVVVMFSDTAKANGKELDLETHVTWGNSIFYATKFIKKRIPSP